MKVGIVKCVKCILENIKRAVQKIAIAIVKKRKSPDTLVVISQRVMGDLLYVLAFLKAIKQKNPSQKIVVVAFEKYKFILDTFDSCDKVILIRPNQHYVLFQLRCLTAFLGNSQQMLQAGIFCTMWNVMAFFPNYYEGDMIDYIMAIRRVYGLDESVPPEFHRVLPAKVTCIPNFSRIYEQCVILNPYSNSMELGNVGRTFFEHICCRLKENGYIVYTNVIKDQEPILGSLPLRCSLEELLGIASKVPFMVSLRSGFCDFLMPSGVNLFVIYNALSSYAMYRLKSWDGRGKLEEIYYDESADESETQRLEEAFDLYLEKLECSAEDRPAKV